MNEIRHSAPAVIVAHFESGEITDWWAESNPCGEGAATTRDTVFRIASMSKSFLAATALALRDEGVLDFNLPIDEYVSGMRFTLGGQNYQVTIAELLSNCSGMPEDNAWGDRHLGATREWIGDLGRAGFRLTSRPGERYQYSNLGMSLVGRAIERVTGRSVEEEVKQRFLDPLALNHTRYRPEEYAANTQLARGFRSFDNGATFLNEPFVGSGALDCIGGLFSTVDDIARWAWFLSSAFDAEAEAVGGHAGMLSARSRREMQLIHTPIPISNQTPPRDLDALGYGLGLFVELDQSAGSIASHAGGLPGFSSHMRWHLATGRGVVVFGNSDAFSATALATKEFAERLKAAEIVTDWATPWPETLAAAEHIDSLLRSHDSIATLEEIVASNFFMDIPAEVRDRRVDLMRAELGTIHNANPLDQRIVASDDASHMRWRVDYEHGALECEIRLIGIEPPKVQSLSITQITQISRVPSQAVSDRKCNK